MPHWKIKFNFNFRNNINYYLFLLFFQTSELFILCYFSRSHYEYCSVLFSYIKINISVSVYSGQDNCNVHIHNWNAVYRTTAMAAYRLTCAILWSIRFMICKDLKGFIQSGASVCQVHNPITKNMCVPVSFLFTKNINYLILSYTIRIPKIDSPLLSTRIDALAFA